MSRNFISDELFERIVSSASTHEVPREHWPHWTDQFDTEVCGLYAWRTPEDVTQAGTTIADAEGVFDLIRESGTTQYQWKAYRYVVLRVDGRAEIVGPFKDIDYEHHTNFLPPWEIAPRSE